MERHRDRRRERDTVTQTQWDRGRLEIQVIIKNTRLYSEDTEFPTLQHARKCSMQNRDIQTDKKSPMMTKINKCLSPVSNFKANWKLLWCFPCVPLPDLWMAKWPGDTELRGGVVRGWECSGGGGGEGGVEGYKDTAPCYHWVDC